MTAPWRSEADRQDHRDRVRELLFKAKTVRCEPCNLGHHDACIRPCFCRNGHWKGPT